MRLSQEADYAVRCILFLTEQGEGVTMVSEVATAMAIPRSFLAKIMQKLGRAGLVRSQRGVGGGFVLAKQPADITVLAVVQAVEGPVALNRCATVGHTCTLQSTCTVHPVWKELTSIVEDYLGNVTFASLKPGRRGKSVSPRPDPSSEAVKDE